MGTKISKADVRKLLEGEGSLKEVVGEMLTDPDVLEDLADEISDAIEDDPRFRQKGLAAAKKTEGFNELLVKVLVDELD